MRSLLIGTCSGSRGDRASAMREVLEGGALDVLTGDYPDPTGPGSGGAVFLRQLEPLLATIWERGTKVVVHPGGDAPAACARAVRDLAAALGLALEVAHVEGDDLLPRLPGWELTCDEPLDAGRVLTARTALGAWGIAAALDAGAQVVVTGRVAAASLVVGPAASHFGWARDDRDRLAAAAVVGRVLAGGTRATGGDYSFVAEEVARPLAMGLPLAELFEDGSALVTKHPGTGGAVTVGTVTAQLLDGVRGPMCEGPDVMADLSSVRLERVGTDLVRLTGVRGGPPSGRVEVAVTARGGLRDRVDVVLTGLDIEGKAALVLAGLDAASRHPLQARLVRLDRPDRPTQEQAGALLRVEVRDGDAAVGPAFHAAVREAVAGCPGATTGPLSDPEPYALRRSCLVDAGEVEHVVGHADGRRQVVPPSPAGPPRPPSVVAVPPAPAPGPTRRVPLGAVAGARSAGSDGTATVGLWARSDEAAGWLLRAVTPDLVRALLPEAAGLPVRVHRLPHLRAVTVTVAGLLGDEVPTARWPDTRAAGLGEHLRSRLVDVPVSLLG